MAEPPTQEVSKDVAVPPKKRSLFRKQIVPQPVDEDEEVEGVAFFSRAKDLYPMRLAEEERRRQKKLEKVQRKRSSTSAERKTPNTPEVKRRRVSSQVDEQSTDGSPGGDDDKDDDGKHNGLGGTRRCVYISEFALDWLYTDYSEEHQLIQRREVAVQAQHI